MIACNPFVHRQTPISQFSHTSLSWDELESLVADCFLTAKQGYREGVLLVTVPPDDFYTSLVVLQKGDKLTGEYTSRTEGETPRKSVTAWPKKKAKAKHVEIVLYSSALLAEDGDNSLEPSANNWEIISINASPLETGEMPMNPETLMANHFGADGGTDTKMSDSEFVKALRESYEFWKDKALATPTDGA